MIPRKANPINKFWNHETSASLYLMSNGANTRSTKE